MGGGNHFDRFLSPVFHASTPALNSAHTEPGEATPGEQQAEGPEPQTSRRTELTFTGISVVVAFLGLGLAWLLYHHEPQLPSQIAESLNGLYTTVLNKYYVDEIYAAVFVKPLIAFSTNVLWHGVDQNVFDASLNNSADGANHVSDLVRHMQSGNIRSYAGWIAAGAAAVIFYMVWLGVRTP